MTSLYQEQKAKRAKAKAHKDDVYRRVNSRDKFTCRACGRRADPRATARLDRGHHHHIVMASAGGPTERWNLCLIDAECHDKVHDQRTLEIEGNADVQLTFTEYTWDENMTTRTRVREWFD